MILKLILAYLRGWKINLISSDRGFAIIAINKKDHIDLRTSVLGAWTHGTKR